MLDERFHPAQRFCQADKPRIEADLLGMLRAVEAHGHHATEATHLLCRQFMPWVLLEPRVEHLLDLGSRLQEFRYSLRIRAVAVHAHRQRLNTAGG